MQNTPDVPISARESPGDMLTSRPTAQGDAAPSLGHQLENASLSPRDTLARMAESGSKQKVVIETESGQIELDIVSAANQEGCVDPRKAQTFIQPQPDVATAIDHHENVDRTPHDEGEERSPGASMGKAMTLLGAVQNLGFEMSPEEAVDLVAEWEESEGRNFALHEDTHRHGLGCGHVDRASKPENESLYGLSAKKVLAMRDYVAAKAQRGEMKVEAPMLGNEHKESAVIVVLGTDATVRATKVLKSIFDLTKQDMMRVWEDLLTF